MADETRNDQASAGEEKQQSDAGPSDEELLDEINRLGARFTEVVQAAWNSEERKKLEADLRRSANALGTTLEESMQKISDNQKAKDLVDQADDVMTNVGDKVRSSEVTHDLSSSLAKGLRKMSDQLEKWISEMESKAPVAGGPSDDDDTGKEIPIDKA
jgi:HSP90 family molecular chaperone